MESKIFKEDLLELDEENKKEFACEKQGKGEKEDERRWQKSRRD